VIVIPAQTGIADGTVGLVAHDPGSGPGCRCGRRLLHRRQPV